MAKKTESSEESENKTEDSKQQEEADANGKEDNSSEKTIPAKRKQPGAPQDRPEKAPRRSARGKSKSSNTTEILKFLLSDEALPLCRPRDETEALKDNEGIKTYSTSELSQFEELISAVVLSRPISHMLGLRTIRTILNEPYNLSSPKAILDAGDGKVHQALWDAKTQHKDKTADQLTLVAKVLTEELGLKSEDVDLEEVRKKAGNEKDKIEELLTSKIKGLGKTGMSIFFRRVQWLWQEIYPYVDDKTGKALDELDLPSDAKELVDLVDSNWDDLKDSFTGHEEQKAKRRAFVVLLERAIGAQLEKNIDVVLEKVEK